MQDYARRIINAEKLETGMELDPITQMPSGIIGRIVLKEPSLDHAKAGLITIDRLFGMINDSLASSYLNVWVLFDRLDVAFVDNHLLEANALRALIRTYLDFKTYENISLKIFLREDIWAKLVDGGFREYSHIVKYIVLSWTDASLLNLLMRRMLANDTLVANFILTHQPCCLTLGDKNDYFINSSRLRLNRDRRNQQHSNG